MRSTETSAKTRQEAIKKALDELGVELHEVEIEILNEGSKGFLGFGARDVRVRVSTEVPAPAPRRSERRERRDERPPRPEKSGAQEGPRPPRADRGDRPRQGRGGGSGEKPARTEKPERQPQAQPRPEKQQPRRERPAASQRPRAEAPRPKPVPAEPAPPREPLPPISDERREEVTAFLRDILTAMGFEATVTSTTMEDGNVRLNIESADSAILIGRKGNNLEALQYLLNRMIATSETDLSERITIDIEGYLERRRQSIEEMARQFALKAKETAREVHMKPMSAQERRIVHVALQDDPEVRTFSTGSSGMRGVVIQPKNQARDENRPRRQRGGSGRRGGSRRPRRGPRPDGQAGAPNSGEAQTRDQGPSDSGDAQES